MSAETFFARWSRRKAESADTTDVVITDAADAGTARSAADAHAAPAGAVAKPPPTLEDVAALTTESDFTPFVARGVDETVRRSAMKKLFTDPHFNVMDGLDIYIDDYSKFEPIPPEMLAALNHAKDLLNPLALLERLSPQKPAQPQPQPQTAVLADSLAAGSDTEEATPDPSPAALTDATLVPEARTHDDSIQGL